MQKRHQSSIDIIGPQYRIPHFVDLVIVRKVTTLTDNFTVTDINGKIFFNLKAASLISLYDHRLLLDAAGKTVVLTLQRKVKTRHDRWEAFRGESTELKDLIFSVKRSSIMFQLKTKLDVFLASNTKEEICDFKVKGSWFERSCVVYAGKSHNIVAQMHKKEIVESVAFGKDNLTVRVYPNIDYAFMVAVILILDEVNQEKIQQQ
ncbi:protein LURP-one-related 15-like isoform X2 [Cicer arietinum]|uniref:Protein LURP-one-related 15-like isoform X2 n=1 Tax=Cicer arietinum TaxID=3827 RepID=A0A1S2Z4F4_CICAR|nr:protein LURP-one-related 15-like isoform X2 [Cicer arietinum]